MRCNSFLDAVAITVGPANFDADNGTAESSASFRYTGKISLLYNGMWETVSNVSLPRFSAVCWYTGKNYFDAAMDSDSAEPLGLMLGDVSGTPIEVSGPPSEHSCPDHFGFLTFYVSLPCSHWEPHH